MKQQPIFIIGRFRSGTSHFWHIFNQLTGFKAWYEPLHPQLISEIEYTQPKSDHVNIEDYWAAYRELDDLKNYHSSRLGSERLYLTARDSWGELRRYLDYLMAMSGDNRPVLQFNRMDFRWPWLQGFYPQAQTLYLKRNPIQLWYSQRKHIPLKERNNESYADAYELMQWSAELSPILPFLAPQIERHGFYRFYILYRLSVAMGSQQADVVIDLDEDVFNTDAYLDSLKVFGLTNEQRQMVQELKSVPDRYAMTDDELDELSKIMTVVDTLFEESGLDDFNGDKSLHDIKAGRPEFWQQQQHDAAAVIRELNHSWHKEVAEKTEMLFKLDALKAKSNSDE